MLKRFVTAAILGGLAVIAVLRLETPVLLILFVLIVVAAAVEFVRLVLAAGGSDAAWLLVPAVAALGCGPLISDPGRLFVLLAVSPLVLAVLALFRGGEPRAIVVAMTWLAFGVAYLVLPLWAVGEIHVLDPRLLLVLLLSVWANDVFAYLVGSRFGRRPMAPRLSPKKTLEGALAGMVAGVGVGVAGTFLLDGSSTPGSLLLWVAVGMATQIGDLLESALKRAVGIKDSGTMLPGHGGMLDRLDAILLAAPLFWVLQPFASA